VGNGVTASWQVRHLKNGIGSAYAGPVSATTPVPPAAPYNVDPEPWADYCPDRWLRVFYSTGDVGVEFTELYVSVGGGEYQYVPEALDSGTYIDFNLIPYGASGTWHVKLRHYREGLYSDFSAPAGGFLNWPC
jgi:hypothetical protein